MKLRTVFIAVALAVVLTQLVTVRPIDEAIVRSVILAAFFALVYGAVRLANRAFSKHKR
jgi:hypothetical protein